MNKLIIGTRGSQLALWQAHHLENKLIQKNLTTEIKIIKTKGDDIQELGFSKLEGKGFFTKEIENELIGNNIDIAVHSLKDLPTEHPEPLVIGGLSERAPANDLLIIKKSVYTPNEPLKIKKNGTIGTSSIRRKVFLKNYRPDLQYMDIRGNVNTRLNKLLNQPDLDAIILAKAGMDRLNIDLSAFYVIVLHTSEVVPAAGQGVIAYQCRKSSISVREILADISDVNVINTVNVERKVLQLMGGGCQTPFGVHCTMDDMSNYHCVAMYATDEKNIAKAQISSSTHYQMAETIVDNLKKVIDAPRI